MSIYAAIDGNIRNVHGLSDKPRVSLWRALGLSLMIWMGMISVSAGQTISTIAGGGFGVPDIGDGGPADAATFVRPVAVFLDKLGNLYVVDSKQAAIQGL